MSPRMLKLLVWKLLAPIANIADTIQHGTTTTGGKIPKTSGANTFADGSLVDGGSGAISGFTVTDYTEAAAPAGVAGHGKIWEDSTSHEWTVKENNGSAKTLRKRSKVILSGQIAYTAGTPVNTNITGATNIQRISRGRFWISAGTGIGANVSTTITLSLFCKDAFTHAELGTALTDGLIKQFDPMAFTCQDIKVASNHADTTLDIDSTADMFAGQLIRITSDNTTANSEYQRISSVSDADTLALSNAILKAGTPAYAADNDVANVLEIRDVSAIDQDGTSEIHLRADPLAGGSNGYLNYVIEVVE